MLDNNKKLCKGCAESISNVYSSIYEFEDYLKEEEINQKSANCFLKPLDIKNKLDEYIVGQEYAKKVLSVACYNHYKRNALGDTSIKKSNVLLIGPTGSGKTYLVETLAKILDVPFVITAATSLTEAGYIGDDVESVVAKLLSAADGDVQKAEKGIIFIDEIDKLSGRSTETEKRVGGKGVQQALLPILEGTTLYIGKQEGMSSGMKTRIDTSGILFICGGAFPEVEDIIKKRLTKKVSIGFNSVVEQDNTINDNILKKVTIDDLREFGLIPEFLGRLPIIAPLESLTEEMLMKILSEPKGSIVSQYQKLFNFDNIKLVFKEDALRAIAKKAIKKGTGARSLRGILEELLLDLMFYVPSSPNVDKIYITKDFVEGTGGPVYHEKSDLVTGASSF